MNYWLITVGFIALVVILFFIWRAEQKLRRDIKVNNAHVDDLLSNEKKVYRATVEQWEADRAHDREVPVNDGGRTVNAMLAELDDPMYGLRQEKKRVDTTRRQRDLHHEAVKKISDNIILPVREPDDNLLEGLLASPIQTPPRTASTVAYHARPAHPDADDGRSSDHHSAKDHHSHSSPAADHTPSHSSHDYSSSDHSSSTSYDSGSSSSSDSSSSDGGSSSSGSDY